MTVRNPTLENLAVASVALEDASRWLQDETSADNVAMALADMVEVKRLAARVYDDIEKHLLSLMPARSIEVQGVGRVESKHQKTYTEWRHDEVFQSVLARIADEPGVFFDVEDGTMLPPAVLAANLVARLRDVLTPDWKLGSKKNGNGLRGLGLDESEFCKVTPKKWSIKVSVPDRPASEPGEGTEEAA